VAQEDGIRYGHTQVGHIHEEGLVSRVVELVIRDVELVHHIVELVSHMAEHILPEGSEGGVIQMDVGSEVQVPHHTVAALLAGDTPLVGAAGPVGDNLVGDPHNIHSRTCFLPLECVDRRSESGTQRVKRKLVSGGC